MKSRKFPVFWSLVLLFGVIWFGKELGFIPWGLDIPWLPIIVILFALRGISKSV